VSSHVRPELSVVPALLEQSYRESWEYHRRSLEAPPGVWPAWDWIVLTAANERQAQAYQLQIDWRRRAGLLPRATRFAVISDPEGRRVGSGGATINALAEVARRQVALSRARKNKELANLFAWKRVLILHSGGESRRLPHCSALGKVFARVPRELPDGRPSTLFDEFLISLSGVPFRMHEGVFVVSGDVLLLFDHRQLDLSRQGVVGVAARAPAEVGTRHGVYVAESAGDRVRRFLHKANLAELHSAGAIDATGNLPIDTGMVWFDPGAVAKVMGLFEFDETMRFSESGPFAEIVAQESQVNLYSDLLMPLAAETKHEDYLADASDGPPTPAVQHLRPLIWEGFRGVPFRVESLSPVEFIHFGTTTEYMTLMTEGLDSRIALGWNRSVSSFRECGEQREGVVVLGSSLRWITTTGANRCVVEDCHLGGDLAVGNRCLASHVWSESAIVLEAGLVLHQLPVAAAGGAERGFVTRLYGVEDNPKLLFGESGATFLNRSWAVWLREAAVSPEQLWEGVGGEERSLWNARLFPFAPTREESLALTLWMHHPAAALEETRQKWLAAPRLSLAESACRADVLEILEDLKRLDDLVRVQRFCEAVEREEPSREAIVLLGDRPGDVQRRSAMAAKRFAHSVRPMLPIRGFKAIADALQRQEDNKWCVEQGRRYEDRAFDVLARAIREATPRPRRVRTERPRLADRPRRATVQAPARIDFAGGWSDTPPFSIEYGGKVLNAAVRVRGRLPVRVECEILDRPVLVLESFDLGVSREFDQSEAILRYADPSDPLALFKAAVVLSGLVRAQRGRGEMDFSKELDRMLGGGLRIAAEVALPHGSGLGTSSILAGALLACLRVILGRPVEFETIYDEVLCLEQMLTTGGGWQDQIGGMVGGIKLATTEPGLPQRPHIEPVKLRPDVAEPLRRRLVLIYTGQRRLAKGILRNIMGRFMSRDPEVVQILCGIREIAEAQRRALERGDLDEMGRLMTEHWEMNKRMDPGTSNPFIDRLFELCAPYASGAKLAGAGGGGFMELIARDEEAPAGLADILLRTFPGTAIGPWPSEIAEESLMVGS